MDPYLKQKVLTASPAQLISYVYDLGISSCINRDKIKLNKVLAHLKSSLRYEPKTEDISKTFFSVYEHLSFLIKNDKFDEAKNIFTEVKLVWKQANKLQ
tara:strand:+ start:416 stop:712 length:297 start_codon:yes stop_codon:yes gene_type:complete